MTEEVKARLTLTSSDGESETVNTFDCTFKLTDGGALIKYTDEKNASAVVRIAENKAQIVRGGEFGLRLRVIPGEETNGYMKTPYGELAMSVKGISVSSDITENGGSAEIRYSIGSEISLRLDITQNM